MRTPTITTTCDLCGYGGMFSRPDDFTTRSGFDFCRWCMSGPVRETSCGGHTVTVADGSWSCDCGMTMAMLKLTLFRYGASHAAMGAVPHLDAATAAIHVQTPRWPSA
jgi:hypothetical protein